ncbi:tetratricopeptide repeat protein [Olsenella profusa]|uniref:Tetratricopeptide repeat protein n=1 Tax=Olsenella profusa TaxID=138595 RepID=A0ABS2F3G2_9ACTN|nr:tetratricopeptide repeat protein [Olsenella profusa]MBM6775425.1 tetratricopeptide repeat protein [Olsenella profusa]
MRARNNGRKTHETLGFKIADAVLICLGCLVVVAAAVQGDSLGGVARRSLVRAGVLLCAVGLGALFLAWHHRHGKKEDERAQSTEAAEPTASASQVNLEGMLRHSDDVVGTLRDIASHGAGHGDFGTLAALLGRVGVLAWEDAPRLTANKLRCNGRWWLTCVDGTLEGRTYEQVVSLEAALNVNEDLRGVDGPPVTSAEQAALRAGRVFAAVADLEPRSAQTETFRELLLEQGEERGEWRCRIGLADRCESLPAPFRVEVDYQSNVGAGMLCVGVAVPGPGCFSLLADDAAGRADAARSYALRLGLAVGRCGLDALPAPGRVIVNCHEHGSDDTTLLSLDLTREALERLRTAVRDRGALMGRLPADGCLSYRVGRDGWLVPVRPFAHLTDGAFCPPRRWREVELDDTPTEGALRTACGAARVSDLGIMEKAGRAAAWNGMVAQLGTSTQDVVSKLVGLRDATNDLTVAEACERTSKALVEGSVDTADRRALAYLFVDGGQLARVARRASALFKKDEITPEKLEGALAELEGALSPITDMGIYLDDSDNVYRYFNSTAERVHYNRTAHDDGRRVRLVPDEYYGALANASRILNALGRTEDALVHADELMRVAPVTPDATLTKVRCLEEQSRIFEAADLLKEAIGYSSTARDLAICFYRLAFMEWKLGRGDLCVACYQRAISLHTDIAPQARSELADLLSTEEGLRPLADDEVVPALERGGLPAGGVDELRLELRDALVACTDAELFGVARQLASALIELYRDDALIDVRHSLVRP